MGAHKLFPLSEMAAGTARKVEVEGHPISLVRIDDDVYAIGDICSHEDVSLSEGYVDTDERLLECWRHGAMFNLKTGHPETLPAIKPVPVYEVAVIEGIIHLSVEADLPATDAEGGHDSGSGHDTEAAATDSSGEHDSEGGN